MKVRVNIIEESIPAVGERFSDEYVVDGKVIDGNMCILNLRREQ